MHRRSQASLAAEACGHGGHRQVERSGTAPSLKPRRTRAIEIAAADAAAVDDGAARATELHEPDPLPGRARRAARATAST